MRESFNFEPLNNVIGCKLQTIERFMRGRCGLLTNYFDHFSFSCVSQWPA